MNIILVGFMGSGKSSTARFISKNYSLRFVDTDRIVEKKFKMTVREMFEQRGERFFRNAERGIIHTNLSFCSGCVIATGGGLPCYFDNMKALKKIGWVFWLNLDFEEIISRVKNKTHRPLLDDLQKARLLFEKRIDCYRDAHFVINASMTTYDMAQEIMSKINS